MTRVTVRLLIKGRVQGVSFRAVMKARAGHHRVEGWVRNKDDGSVEALLQGDEEAVSRLVEWAGVGPPGAMVASVTEEKRDGHPRQRGFRVTD